MKTWKIILLICGGFFLIAALTVGFIVSKFTSDVDAMEQKAERLKAEYDRIEALPEIKGIISSDKEYVAPFANEPAALVFINPGYQVAYSRGSGKKRLLYQWEFERLSTVLPNHLAKIKIGNELYEVHFKQAIVLMRDKKEKRALTGMEFSPNRDFSSGRWNATPRITPEYEKQLETFRNLKEIDPDIANYLKKSRHKTSSNQQGFIVRDILFRNGDSIILKGKMQGNKIIPLY